PVTGRGNDVVAGGAADIWMQVTWNGFQRGPNEAAAPVRVARADSAARRGDSTARRDSTGRDSTRRDTLARARDAAVARGDTTPPRPPRDSTPRRPPSAPAAAGGFLVQFAALRAEAPARQLAATIRAEGVRARVVATGTGEFTVHRVILGPYPTRADAERAGQAAGRDYWIYDGGRP
nr:SPOR domain-containing protein [Gemmatimonadaceae bacterium]MCU0627117.1 SPOR domain-containing protein [Gemmatimonadaceae bacterium]